jgi:hypothetical protein
MDRMVALPGLVVPTAEIPVAAGVVPVEALAESVAEETTMLLWLENYL